jgi:hypothetical protein
VKLRREKWQPALDVGALKQACSMLGVNDPVVIGVDDELSIDGYYQRVNDEHHITLNPELSIGEASKTIWHELAHAAQCELDFDGDGAAFHDAAWDAALEAELSNTVSKLEVEARAAEMYDYDLRLVRMVKV